MSGPPQEIRRTPSSTNPSSPDRPASGQTGPPRDRDRPASGERSAPRDREMMGPPRDREAGSPQAHNLSNRGSQPTNSNRPAPRIPASPLLAAYQDAILGAIVDTSTSMDARESMDVPEPSGMFHGASPVHGPGRSVDDERGIRQGNQRRMSEVPL